MSFLIKKLFLGLIFNSCLFAVLFIGIQNSSDKNKVDFLIDETIKLPVSFIIGTNFIFGSLIGTSLSMNLNEKN